ncbi:reverse transcriptase domain-containing protein [Tanacetum coccineum]
MVAIFHDMIEKTMEVFMDDFSVFGDSFSSCLSHLDKMLQRCEDTNLVLNWEKCHFMVKEGIVLGHKISKSGIEVDKAKKLMSLQNCLILLTVQGFGYKSTGSGGAKLLVSNSKSEATSAKGSLAPEFSGIGLASEFKWTAKFKSGLRARVMLEGVPYPDTIRKGTIHDTVHRILFTAIVHWLLSIATIHRKKSSLMDEQAIHLLLKEQSDALHAQIAALATEWQAAKLIQPRPEGGEQGSWLPRFMRLEVPKFNGTEPESWIFAIQEYFDLL